MTNKAEKRGLVPKLRFPEFREAGGWESKSMGEVYSFKGNNSLSRDKLNYESGSIKNIHYGDIHTKFSTLFDISKETVPYINASESQESFKAENYCVEGDMVFADASEDLADIGKCIEIVRLNGERVVSGLHTILARQSVARLVIGFGGYLFKSHAIRKQIQKESQGAKVLGLSGGRFAKVTIPFPSDKTEQQKIADCLASLDERITLEAQKLDTHQTHKKGLMQQLFPAEGETLPKLRFLEFQEAGEWEEKPIGKIATLRNGFAFKSSTYIDNGCYKIITIGNVQAGALLAEDAKTISELPPDIQLHQQLQVGDILISMTGNVGRICRVDVENCLLNQRVGKLVLHGANKEFFYHSINNDCFREAMQSRAAGGAQGNLSSSAIEEYILLIPQKNGEQQKIADCLASLDDLITAQTQKLAALKTHKKGLMQQLFPVLEERPA